MIISQITNIFLYTVLHKTRIWNITSRRRIPFSFIQFNSIQAALTCINSRSFWCYIPLYPPSLQPENVNFGCFLGCCKQNQRIKSHISTLVETFGQSDPGDFPWQHPARPSGNFMIKGSTWMVPWIFMLSMPLPRWKPTPLKRTNFQNALCIKLLESSIPATAPSQKAHFDDISGTKRGTIDPLVSKRPEKNSE